MEKHQINEIIIKTKNARRKGKTEVLLSAMPVGLSEQELLQTSHRQQENIIQQCNQLIDDVIKDHLITTYIKGNSHLLPRRYQRFYQEVIQISTEYGTIYMTDQAIPILRNKMNILEEKSRVDALEYSKQKISSKEAHHLQIQLVDYVEQSGHKVYFRKNLYQDRELKNVLYYDVEDPTKEKLDIICDIIHEFTNYQDVFHHIEWDHDEIVAKNFGSMKITGIKNYHKVLNKVLELSVRR